MLFTFVRVTSFRRIASFQNVAPFLGPYVWDLLLAASDNFLTLLLGGSLHLKRNYFREFTLSNLINEF